MEEVLRVGVAQGKEYSIMQQFQPGEDVYIRLTFQNAVPLDNAYIIFVHEEAENEHIVFGLASEYTNVPIQPRPGRILTLAVAIPKDQKPGVYALDKINFETFSGNTLDYKGDVGTPKFEVVPEYTFAPLVEDLSIFNLLQWEAIKRREQ